MQYMLDTNIIVYAKNKRPESVLNQLTAQRPSDVCISAISMAELEFGVCHSSRPDQNRLALMSFLSAIQIIPFDSDAAREYGQIRQDLTQDGNLIGSNDMLIAAHAKALGLILVTNNTREFERVKGLHVENWA
ncbi:MAG: type II toxin-antitoxin system VapC family toxin [Oscillospiraceae bacterium]|nr:type II toxin-antitoxin system VapC family toxin [Oscillospiraceae bacterium]